MENAAELETQLVESINAIKTIKQLNLEEFNNIKTETRFIRLLDSTYKSGLNSIFSGNTSQLITRAFTIVLLWSGSYLVINQTITPGELMSFYALIGYFTGPVSSADWHEQNHTKRENRCRPSVRDHGPGTRRRD